MNKREIVRLPMVMASVLVALVAKVMSVLPPPGILLFTESMPIVFVPENKGEREKLVPDPLGLLALEKFPSLKEDAKFQES